MTVSVTWLVEMISVSCVTVDPGSVTTEITSGTAIQTVEVTGVLYSR